MAALSVGYQILPTGTDPPRLRAQANCDLNGTKSPTSLHQVSACQEQSPTVFGAGLTSGFFFPLTEPWKLWVRRDLLGHPVLASCQWLWELISFHWSPFLHGTAGRGWDSGDHKGLQTRSDELPITSSSSTFPLSAHPCYYPTLLPVYLCLVSDPLPPPLDYNLREGGDPISLLRQ